MRVCLTFILLPFLLFHMQFFAFAEEVTISGNIQNAAGMTVQLIGLSDQVSKLELILVQSIVAVDGDFEIKTNLDHTKFTYLQVGLQRGEIYLEPGHHYTVNTSVQQSPYHFNLSNPVNLRLDIHDSREPALNTLIQEFNLQYNQFMLENFNDSYSRVSKSKVSELINELNDQYQDLEHPYFSACIKYRLAMLELSGRAKSNNTLAHEYFAGKPILYDNVEYMEFFNQFFSQFLVVSHHIISGTELLNLVNEQENYNGLEEALKRFPYLGDAQFRELALIRGLKDLYYTPGFDRAQVLLFLKQIGQKSKFNENRVTAENLVTSATRFSPGSKAPEMTLRDPDNKSTTLSSLPQLPAYLVFYSSSNLSCIAEMDLLKPLAEEFRGKILFVSISLDGSVDNMKKIKQERAYDWIFLHAGGDSAIITNYELRRLPTCVMIDGNKSFLQYSAPSPSENLAGYLYQVLK